MRTSRIAILVCVASGLLPAQTAAADDGRSYRKVSFYFAAHEDDWQLFMNPTAFADVLEGDTKTVFVHLTAGDAWLGTGNGGRRHPYYLARENGAESAIRFMADATGLPLDEAAGPMRFNDHPIHRVSYRNTAA